MKPSILYRATAPEDSAPEWFRLHLIQPGLLGERNGQPIQYVLPTISSLRDRNELPYVELDPSALVRFTLPAELAEPMARLVSFLKTANAEQGSELALVEQAMTGSSTFSYEEYRRTQRPLRQSHRAGGLERTDMFNEGQLEPFGVWRQIRFLEFKVSSGTSLSRPQLGHSSGGEEGRKSRHSLNSTDCPPWRQSSCSRMTFAPGGKAFGDLVMSMI